MAIESEHNVWLHRAGSTIFVGSEADLEEWAKAGRLHTGDMLRMPGENRWVPAEKVPEVGARVWRPSPGPPVPIHRTATFWALCVAAALAIFVALTGDSQRAPAREASKAIPTAWREPAGAEHRVVGKALVGAGASGCGCYHVREIPRDRPWIQVRCSPSCSPPYRYWQVSMRGDVIALPLDEQDI